MEKAENTEPPVETVIFNCDTCEFVCASKQELGDHYKIDHAITERRIICQMNIDLRRSSIDLSPYDIIQADVRTFR